MNSKAMPYMCAMGSMEMMREPAGTFAPKTSMANW